MKENELAQLVERLEQVFREWKNSSSSDSDADMPIVAPKIKTLPPPVTLKTSMNEGKPLTLNPSVTRLSPLQAELKQAVERGEDIQGYVFQCLVFERQDQQGNSPLPFLGWFGKRGEKRT